MGIFSGIIGALVAVCLIWFKDWLSAKRERKSQAQYLAVRVVCDLTLYISACFVFSISKTAFFEMLKEEKIQLNLTASPVYATDIDWKSIDHKLAFNILTLQTVIAVVEKQIDVYVKKPDIDADINFAESMYCSYIKSGVEAVKIVKILQDKYDLHDEYRSIQVIEESLNESYEEALKSCEENKE